MVGIITYGYYSNVISFDQIIIGLIGVTLLFVFCAFIVKQTRRDE